MLLVDQVTRFAVRSAVNASQSAVPPPAKTRIDLASGNRSPVFTSLAVASYRSAETTPPVQAHLRQPVNQSSNTFIHSDSLIEWLSGLDAIRSRNDAGDHTRRIDTRT